MLLASPRIGRRRGWDVAGFRTAMSKNGLKSVLVLSFLVLSSPAFSLLASRFQLLVSGNFATLAQQD